jgi:hypothetical protein
MRRSSIRVSTYLASVLLLLSACAIEERTASPHAESSWRAVLSLSGGFSGAAHEISIDGATRALAATDLRRGRRTSRLLTEPEYGELEQLIALAPQTQPPASRSTCRDCYVYDLTVFAGDARRSARYDSMTLQGEADEPLVQRMAQLGRELLRANPD